MRNLDKTMRVVADLQVHSKYSRAVSKDMNLATMAMWAKKKGIDLLATGDWTHPLWFAELRENLKEAGEGVCEYEGTKFLLATEISSIFSQGGRVRRVHTLVWAPNFEIVEKINKELVRRGCNLMSDGRPIIGLSCRQLAGLVFGIDESCLLIPAHAWTPWFSVYGASGGFDSIEEAFGEYADRIYAVETGLSSDPAMNWRIPELDRRAIVSFSDAHSPRKLGRETTVFEVEKLTYREIAKLNVAYTVEFYPEEGKYHYSGHRNCGVVQKMRGICSICGKALTTGVMQRVEELAVRGEGGIPAEREVEIEKDKFGVAWHKHSEGERPPFVRMVPLVEILAEVCQTGVGSKKVAMMYEELVSRFGGEMNMLLKTAVEDIDRAGGSRLAEAIAKVRRGDICIEPGFDGVYGTVKIWAVDQQTLF